MQHWKNPFIWLFLLFGLASIALWVFAFIPTEAERQVAAAQQSLDAGQPLLASAYFAAAAQADPGRPALWSQAASAALDGGDPQAAVRYFELNPQRTPNDYLLLGQAYSQLGDLPQAARSYQQAAVSDGPVVDAYENLLQIHRMQQDYPAAQADLQALLKSSPSDAAYNYQLGLLLAALQPEAALPYLATAVQLDPVYESARAAIENAIRTSRYYEDPAYTALACGRALASLDEWDLAAEAFRRALADDETYGEAWAYLAEARQQLNEDGTVELSKALALAPNSVAVNLLAALYWQRQKDFDQALIYLDAAAKIEPGNPVIQAEIGRTQAEKGDLPAAESYYRRAIELAPNEPTYYRLLAEFALKQGIQTREIALPAARQSLLLDPEDPLSLDLIAQVLLNLDDPLTAERFLQQAVQLAPDDPAIRLHLGQVYWLRGETEWAHLEWQHVLAVAPGSTWAQEARRWLER